MSLLPAGYGATASLKAGVPVNVDNRKSFYVTILCIAKHFTLI